MRTADEMLTHRQAPLEQQREADLLRLMPARGSRALDIGARDGHFSRLMAERFDEVVALDLQRPDISCARVVCVQGNAAQLQWPDGHFDFVLCAEVLEHVPPAQLGAVCSEIQRVCRGQALIGVPNEQDIRVGRLSCRACGRASPPWGHVNRFDHHRLQALFSGFDVQQLSFVGTRREATNAPAAWLMDRAGNPHADYSQDETCGHCGQPYDEPPERGLGRKLLTRLATWARRATEAFAQPTGNWVHVLFAPRAGGADGIGR